MKTKSKETLAVLNFFHSTGLMFKIRIVSTKEKSMLNIEGQDRMLSKYWDNGACFLALKLCKD